jgi:AraC-like DNA-binding protein
MDFFKIDPSKERELLDFRPLGFQDVILLGRYRYTKAHGGLEDHCHGDMLEICYLERGKQTYFVGQERFDLVGGDVFMTFPDEVHGTGPTPEEKGILYWMLIRILGPEAGFLSLSPEISRPLFDRLLNVAARHFHGSEVLSVTLNRIFKAFGGDDLPLKAAELQNLIMRFLLDVLNAAQESGRRTTPEIAEVRKFVAQNVDCPLSVRQLAMVIGLSESRLKARFKQEVGISPADYVNRTKIDRGKVLLDTGKFSVTDVAMRLGFSTSHHFSTVFKRYTGISPSQYRARRLEAGENLGF